MLARQGGLACPGPATYPRYLVDIWPFSSPSMGRRRLRRSSGFRSDALARASCRRARTVASVGARRRARAPVLRRKIIVSRQFSNEPFIQAASCSPLAPLQPHVTGLVAARPAGIPAPRAPSVVCATPTPVAVGEDPLDKAAIKVFGEKAGPALVTGGFIALWYALNVAFNLQVTTPASRPRSRCAAPPRRRGSRTARITRPCAPRPHRTRPSSTTSPTPGRCRRCTW